MDMQVAMKHERKVLEKETEQKHAAIVKQDVQAFERSKNDKRKELEQKVTKHRESLIKQIDDHKQTKGGLMAPQEFAINKRIIEEVIGGGSPPASPGHNRRPF